MNQVRMMFSMGALVLAGATAFGIGASVSSTPTLMARGDYEALKSAISTETSDLQAACGSLRASSSERHVCQAETRARAQVLLAELEARYRGTFSASRDVALTRIRAKYEVDRAHCFAFAGFKRDTCVVNSHADKARALMALKSEA